MPDHSHASRPGGPGTLKGMLTLEQLEDEIGKGTIDTVVTAFTDMQGRLMGKRIQGEYFLEDVVGHGVEGCNYLLALDMEMDPVPGYDMANWEKGYGDLTPTIPYILDYHVLATTMDEPFIRQLRRGMQGAGIPVEFSKGEAWYGQHELNVRYADAVTSADRHTIYKNGAKEIAHLNGLSASF